MLRAALVAILALAVLTLVAMGLRQWSHRRRLAAVAQELGLSFAAADPFDLPHRYAGFGVMRSGHSAYAANVMHGRVSNAHLHAFDYQCELGHGSQRVMRSWAVVALECDGPLQPLVLLLGPDQPTPLVLLCDGGATPGDGWWRMGDRIAIEHLQTCFAGEAADRMTIEARGSAILFAIPRQLEARRFRWHVQAVRACWEGRRKSAVPITM